MQAPLVSIVMPVFNSGEFLAESISSIISQTFEDWELVIVDDGSTDKGYEIASEFACEDSRIRLIKKPHHGLVSALNAGVDAASTPVIARMDGDDVSLPHRLEKQLEMLEMGKGMSCVVSCLVGALSDSCTGEGMKHYHSWLNSLVTDSDIKNSFFVESPIAHPTAMFKKDDFETAGGYVDHGWPEDYDLWMRMLMRGARFLKVPDKLYLWRDTPSRLSRTSKVYSPVAFRNLKVHYLLKTKLCKNKSITIWGSGHAGRIWAAELIVVGVDILRFVDIDSEKRDKRIGDIPVSPPVALKSKVAGDFILSCVGSRGEREIVRCILNEYGYSEGEDFLIVE